MVARCGGLPEAARALVMNWDEGSGSFVTVYVVDVDGSALGHRCRLGGP